jgi:hypothetical protein
MKSCPYCGKENPDDATVCAIDQKPLDPEMPLPSPKSSRADVLAHLAARPFAVKFAVGALAFGGALDFVQDIARYQSRLFRYPNFQYPDSFYLSTVYTYGIVALFLYLIYRGKNWARWVVLCSIIFGTIAAPFIFIGRLPWSFYFHSLINLIAIIALIQRSSNEWYRGSKKILSQPAAAT